MIQTPKLDALRQRMAQKEASLNRKWPAVSTGAEGLDSALPDGGFPTGVVHELLPKAYGDFAAVLGFGTGMVARLLKARPGFVVWALPAYQLFRQGALYPLGLTALGVDPARIIQVRVPKTQNVLWALEEALGQSSVSVVMGLLPGDDRTYDFTASRRLALRATTHGVTALLIQDHLAPGIATAADMRWQVAAAPCAPTRRRGLSKPGLGPPRWDVELTKSKRGPSHSWQVEWDHETLSFHMAAALADRTAQKPGRHSANWAAAS